MSEISKALLELQSVGQRTLAKDARNPHFKNRYVTLESLLETVTPLLNERGILLVQAPTTTAAGDLGLETRLIHVESGSWFEYVMPLNKLQKDDPQGQGSAITYARRYSLMSMLGLVGEEDDDGNAARTSKSPAKKPATVKKRSAANNGANTDEY